MARHSEYNQSLLKNDRDHYYQVSYMAVSLNFQGNPQIFTAKMANCKVRLDLIREKNRKTQRHRQK